MLLLGSISSSTAPTIEATAGKAAAPRAVSGPLRLRSPLLAPPDEVEAEWDRAVYDRANSKCLWSINGRLTQQAHADITILSAADTFGLEPDDYAASQLTPSASQLKSESLQTQTKQFDILLTRAALRFISHVHYGRIDPRAAGFELESIAQ